MHLKNNFSSKTDLKSGKDFYWNNSSLNVEVHPFSEVAKTGISGVYYLRFQQPRLRNVFLDELQKIGEVKQLSDVSIYIRIGNEILGNFMLLILWGLVSLLTVSLFVTYLLRQKRKVAIQKTFGWKFMESYWNFYRKILFASGVILLISILIPYLYFVVSYGRMNLFVPFVILQLIQFIVLQGIVFFLCWIGIFFFRRKNMESIKGKKNTWGIVCFQTVVRIALVLSFFAILGNMFSTMSEVRNFQKNNKEWELTKNIYTTELRMITQDEDEYFPYEVNLKKFYNTAVKNQDLFVIGVGNYQKSSDGRPLYEENTKSKLEQLTNPNGKSVIVNANYLKRNPIYKEDGTPVSSGDVSNNDTTWTILVPQDLRGYEKEIHNNYLKEFKFRKYLFNDLLKEKEKPLSLKIIYVKNNQKYFTYQPGEGVGFYVTNPVAIVETGNLSPPQYSYLLSNFAYFENRTNDAYESIAPDVLKSNALPSIQSVRSLYSTKAEEIKQKQQLLQTLVIVGILICILLLFTIFMTNATMLQNVQYSFVIKKLFGYKFIELCRNFIGLQFGINALTALILAVFLHASIGQIVLWFVIDAGITIIMLKVLHDRLTVSKLKEEEF